MMCGWFSDSQAIVFLYSPKSERKSKWRTVWEAKLRRSNFWRSSIGENFRYYVNRSDWNAPLFVMEIFSSTWIHGGGRFSETVFSVTGELGFRLELLSLILFFHIIFSQEEEKEEEEAACCVEEQKAASNFIGDYASNSILFYDHSK